LGEGRRYAELVEAVGVSLRGAHPERSEAQSEDATKQSPR
jgi:hypothetical protein